MRIVTMADLGCQGLVDLATGGYAYEGGTLVTTSGGSPLALDQMGTFVMVQMDTGGGASPTIDEIFVDELDCP